MRAFGRALVAAFAFLTRLPVPRVSVGERDFGRAAGFYPLVGLVLGVVVTGLGSLLCGRVPSLLLAVLLVALLAALTGALHLDGLSDLFDGLAGGQGDRQRTLAIMRDSRIGAQGAVALVLLLAAKIAAVSALLDGRDFAALLVSPALGRWAVVPLIVVFGAARPEGLAHAMRSAVGLREILIATAIVLAALAPLGAGVALQAGVALTVALLFGFWLNSRFGGLTGDVYGAAIEIAEVAALITAAVV